jgi:beta-lactamase superfamily II metal-dependent hydrolase
VKTLLLSALATAFVQSAASQTLDIYFIDVEGGQSTLVVTPQREALLIDYGIRGGRNVRIDAR